MIEITINILKNRTLENNARTGVLFMRLKFGIYAIICIQIRHLKMFKRYFPLDKDIPLEKVREKCNVSLRKGKCVLQ